MSMANITTDLNNSISSVSKLPTFTLYLWHASIFFLFGGLAGVFGNSMILIALAVSDELRKNRCNILVANLAVTELIHSGFFIFCGIVTLLSQVNGLESSSMSHQTCFYALIPLVLSMDSSSLTVLAIGIDRALSLTKPLFYKNLSSKYTYIIIAISWICGIVNVGVGWQDRDPNETVPSCVTPVALKNLAFELWAIGSVVVDVLVLISYGVAYWKGRQLAKFRSASNDLVLKNNRLLASLVTFAIVYLTTGLLAMGLVAVSNIVSTDPSTVFHISFHAGMLVMTSRFSNFFIYYARSSEYRKVFRQILHLKTDGIQSTAPKSSGKVISVEAAPNGPS